MKRNPNENLFQDEVCKGCGLHMALGEPAYASGWHAKCLASWEEAYNKGFMEGRKAKPSRGHDEMPASILQMMEGGH
jgi:hypothetical protein